MRTILLLTIFTIFLLPTITLAQSAPQEVLTPEAYYKSCMSTAINNQSYEVQEESCACMSAQMQIWQQEKANFDSQKNQSLYVKKGEMTLDENTLITKIYAPCLHIEAKEQVYLKCYQRKSNQKTVPSLAALKGMCTCQANISAEFVSAVGQPLLESILSRRSIFGSPLDMILDNEDYKREIYPKHTECYNKFTQK